MKLDEPISNQTERYILDQVFFEEIKQPIEKKLLNAVYYGLVEEVRLLVSQGADINFQDECGNSLACIAVIRGHLDVLKVLLSIFTSTKENKYIIAELLHVGAIYGHLDILKHLIPQASDYILDNCILMHIGAINGNITLIYYLIQIGFDIDLQDQYGYTALHYAGQYDQLESIDFLVAHGSYINSTSNEGSTPIDQAIKHNRFHAALKLCILGADIKSNLKYFVNNIFEIFSYGSLVERLTVMLYIYSDFVQSGCSRFLEAIFIKELSKMIDNFNIELNYAKVKTFFEGKTLGDLDNCILQLQNLSKAYTQSKNELERFEDKSFNMPLERLSPNVLIQFLKNYQYNLVKRVTNLSEVMENLPSLFRLKNVDFTGANFTKYELELVANLRIDNIIKLGSCLDTCEGKMVVTNCFSLDYDRDITGVLDKLSIFYYNF